MSDRPATFLVWASVSFSPASRLRQQERTANRQQTADSRQQRNGDQGRPILLKATVYIRGMDDFCCGVEDGKGAAAASRSNTTMNNIEQQ